MSEDNWKKMSQMLDEKLSFLHLKQNPNPESGSSKHKVHGFAEMLSCPECGKGAKDALKPLVLDIMGKKACTHCGHVDDKEEEYCEGCESDY